MFNAGMTLKLLGKLRYVLTIPTATMRAGYPGWEPHLYPADIAYIACDTGTTVEVEFTDDEPRPTPARQASAG